MEPERWRLLEGLFHAAAALEGEARATFLQRSGRKQPGLTAEVERLLAAGEDADRVLTGIIGRGLDRAPG